jgi:hypothetical protein
VRERGGGFAPGTNGGVTGGSFAAVQAAHGAVAVTSPMVAPGETASVSVTLSWYFPNRDYYGLVVGQFYSTLFGSAKDVAGLYDQAHLAAAAADSAAHAAVFAGPAAATLPDWLAHCDRLTVPHALSDGVALCEALSEPLAQLVEVGYVTAQAAPSGATCGRPTTRYAAVEQD